MSAHRAFPPWPGDDVNLCRAHGDPRCCRLCARPGLPTNRHSWHPKCARLGRIAMFGADQFLLRRQRGLCPCGTRLAKAEERFLNDADVVAGYSRIWWQPLQAYEIDHKVPLFDVSRMPPERQTIRWWLPGNLQALCVPCHRAKTKAERVRWARERRAEKQPELL